METIEIVEKIKSGPYWRVNIRPSVYNKDKINSLSQIREMIEQCKVTLRGWYFPHIDYSRTTNGNDWVQSEYTSDDIIEFWRFYQSAQFVHYLSVYEDYTLKAQGRKPTYLLARGEHESPSGYVEILITLYRLTEIYEFAMRLAQKDVFGEGVYIHVTLAGIRNFQLFFFDSGRVLFDKYKSGIDEINLESKMSVQELLAKGHEEAIKQAIKIYERFNWLEPPKSIFIEEQKKLLERRL